jgi:hypothetical protein
MNPLAPVNKIREPPASLGMTLDMVGDYMTSSRRVKGKTKPGGAGKMGGYYAARERMNHNEDPESY